MSEPSSDPLTMLKNAERLCRTRGQRLTPLRRRVLEILLDHDVPIGAYAILDALRQEGHSGGPPTVYRALDFLLHNGLVHRLASLSSFTPCHQPHRDHGAQFLICQHCQRVSEMDSTTVSRCIGKEAAQRGFGAQSVMVEVLGCCEDCGGHVA